MYKDYIQLAINNTQLLLIHFSHVYKGLFVFVYNIMDLLYMTNASDLLVLGTNVQKAMTHQVFVQ